MNDPTRSIRQNTGDLLVTAMTTAGYSTPADRVTSNPDGSTPVPYIRIGHSTPPEDWLTRTSEGHITTHRFIGYGSTETEAYEMSEIITETLVRPATPISLDSPHRIVITEQAGGSVETTTERGGDKTFYGRPVRIRFFTSEA